MSYNQLVIVPAVGTKACSVRRVATRLSRYSKFVLESPPSLGISHQRRLPEQARMLKRSSADLTFGQSRTKDVTNLILLATRHVTKVE